MSLRERLLDFLYYMLMGTLYSYALARGVFASTVAVPNQWALFALCAGAALVYYLVFFKWYTFAGTVFGILITVLILYLYLRTHDFEVEWYREFTEFSDELFKIIFDLIPYQEAFTPHIMVLIAGLAGFVTAILLKVLKSAFLMALAGSCVFAIPFFAGYGISESAMVLFIFCILVVFCRRLNIISMVSQKGLGKRNPRFSLAAIPLAAAVLLISWLLPTPGALMLGTDKEANADVGGVPYDVGSGGIISFSESGGRLGGPVRMNNRVVMEVSAPTDRPVYLVGSAWNEYTGRSWEDTASEDGINGIRYRLTPDGEGIYDTNYYNGRAYDNQKAYLEDFGLKIEEVTIIQAEYQTKIVFSPAFRQSLYFMEEQGQVTEDAYGCIRAGNLIGRGEGYVQEYMAWEYDAWEFDQLLQGLPPNDPAGTPLYDFAPEEYLRLPEELPDRVVELAGQVTAGRDNDAQKIYALQEYLLQFPYTLSPDPVPMGEDFVDYFLFTGKEGYCVYYASALAVMARSAGIPTRYVEGFVTPQHTNANGWYEVTNAQAHAWVEVYFPEFGWVPFEATAPSYSTVNDQLAVEYEEISQAEEEPEESGVESEAESGAEESSRESLESREESGGRDEGAEEEGDRESAGLPDMRWLLWFIPLVGLAALAAWAAVRLWRLRRKNQAREERLRGPSGREASVAYFNDIVKAAKALGYPIHDNETAIAYAQRMGEDIPFEAEDSSMLELAEIFSKAVYSPHEIAKEELDVLKRCHEAMQRTLLQKLGKWRYFLGRKVFFRF